MARRPLDAAARELAEEALVALREVMNDRDELGSARTSAANSILDRGYGKPLSATISVPLTKQLANRLAGMDDDALMHIIEAEPLPGEPGEPDAQVVATLRLTHVPAGNPGIPVFEDDPLLS